MSFASAIANEVLLNGGSDRKQNTMLDRHLIGNESLFYARTLNSHLNGTSTSKRNLVPEKMFTAEGLTVPIIGKQEKSIVPEDWEGFVKKPYLIHQLKQIREYKLLDGNPPDTIKLCDKDIVIKPERMDT
ncbi:U13-like protein [Lissonota sp. PSUC_FEM 10030012]|nr:U13-like protein [Lissonota sp. PSUC_FEM 10030012]